MSYQTRLPDDVARAQEDALLARVVRGARGASGKSGFAVGLTRFCHGIGFRQLDVRLAVLRHSSGRPHLVEIRREQNRNHISCHEWMLNSRPKELFYRLCAVLATIAGVPSQCTHLLADISDGEESGAGLISFCSRDPAAILIPDHSFVRTRGYETYRHLARTNRTAWDERSNWIVWRGLTTGHGAISKKTLSPRDPDLVARIRLCLEMKDIAQADVKLHAIAQSSNLPVDTERLTRAGVLGDYISPIAWCGLKFAIDIDGNTNAWSNFFTRLLMGCCVLKVDSAAGYRQWYYGDVVPWTHYVPVKADLSDLRERIAWCRANLAECRQIAAAGQQFALARGFEREIASATRRVYVAQGPPP
jgi:hypothetical protein